MSVNPTYLRLQATATRLIAQFGKVGAIVRNELTGPPHAPVMTPTAHPVKLVDIGYDLTRIPQTMIQLGDKVGIFSVDVAVEPNADDIIQIDGLNYRFVAFQPLNPGGVVLLYEYIARV
jgi:hypothetical protein